MASWDSACPVDGQCSECGLEFHWREILREDEQVNPRYIEHCPRRAIPIAAVRTLLWCILPWVFWKRVELKHEPRVGRMLLWLVLLLVSVHLLASVMLAIAMWRVEARAVREYNTELADAVPQIKAQLAQIERDQRASASNPRQEEFKARLEQILANMPPPAPSRNLGPAHLAIAIGYPFVLIDDGYLPPNRFSLVTTNQGAPGKWTIELLPFWQEPAVLCGLAFSLTFAAMLSILPATRRKLRIRWVHLTRVTVFGMAWLAVPSLLGMIESVSYIIDDLSVGFGGSPGDKVLLVNTLNQDWAAWCWVFIGWSAIWWLCALWRGLKFPAPLFHWALLFTAAALVALGVIFKVVNPLEIDALLSPSDWFQHSGYFNWPLPERLISGEIQRLR